MKVNTRVRFVLDHRSFDYVSKTIHEHWPMMLKLYKIFPEPPVVAFRKTKVLQASWLELKYPQANQ
jgi:hypothetical protein